jgi:hypothetical protein
LPLNRPDEPGNMFTDTPEAARLRSIADGLGERTVKVALLDDVVMAHRQKLSEEDSWRWAMFTGVSYESLKAGTGAEIVQQESQLEHDGRTLVSIIRTMDLPEGYRLSQDGRKIIVGSGKSREYIPLEGYGWNLGSWGSIDDPTFPSCEVLDLAWLRKRLDIAPEAVTVLPDTEWYRRQQRGVELLSKLFPDMQDKSIRSIFIDELPSPSHGG